MADEMSGGQVDQVPELAAAEQVLTDIVEILVRDKGLTASERGEVFRIARGLALKDSAAAANVSPETTRARRKRIYRKLGAIGALPLLSSMLALSLAKLACGPHLNVRLED